MLRMLGSEESVGGEGAGFLKFPRLERTAPQDRMVNGCPFSFGILVEKLIHAACGKVMDLRKSEPDICGKFGI